ncbi:hypothetical protein [Sinorhizobium fredii]|uniref:hypothetical protein n=1 Tax=Rhizobium fredii TaxID=380 RepID=UPI0004B8BEEE|nr:hypothetical protein [Sinorhizobium fredii]
MGSDNKKKQGLSQAEAAAKIRQMNEQEDLAKAFDQYEWGEPSSSDDELSKAFDQYEWGADGSLKNGGPNPDLIDTSDDAPANVRAAVGALDKPEDRLTALRKYYPDAQPYGEDNFIFTDTSGKVRKYNSEGWIPDGGDIASIIPEIGEGVGAIIGGTGGAMLGAGAGGATGAVAGSVVPVAGTAAGALGGAGYGGILGGMAGAGTGAVVGREATQRGLNWLFDNEDSRTGTEQAADMAKTFALGAAGEGVGMVAGPLVKKGGRMVADLAGDTVRKAFVGGADDAAKVAERVADFDAIGVTPTPGMVSGNARHSRIEHTLKNTKTGEGIQTLINNAHTGLGNEFDRIVSQMTGGKAAMTRPQIGVALKEQTQAAKDAAYSLSNDLYDDVANKVTATPTASNTAKYLTDLTAEKSALSNVGQRIHTKHIDRVIDEAAPLLEDVKNGVGNFKELKEYRTYIGGLANEPGLDKSLKNRLNGLYDALTRDMEETALASGDEAANAWRKANSNYRELSQEFGKKSLPDTVLKKDSDLIFREVYGNMKDGGNKVSAIRRTITKEEGGEDQWAEIQGSIISDIGKKGPDQPFEISTFLSNWNNPKKFSKEAKEALFKGTKNDGLLEDLNRVGRLAEELQKHGKFNNHSNTLSNAIAADSLNPFNKFNLLAIALDMGSTGGAATAMKMGTTAAAKAGNWAYQKRVGKLMTNPQFVKWLANVPKAEMQKGGLEGHVKNLVKMYAISKDQAIGEYLRDIGYDKDNDNKKGT